MSDLFESAAAPAAQAEGRPLPDRLRPRRLDEIVGQDHLLAGDAPLRRMIDGGRLGSMILWGPPGAGKTTLLRTILGLLPKQHGLICWNDELVTDPANFFVPPRSAYTPQAPQLIQRSGSTV